MSLTYNTWLTQSANLAGTTATQPNFVTEVPSAIDYAEQRIYRDLQLLVTRQPDSSQTCAPNNRRISVPTAFIVVEDVNIITPAGSIPDNGTRNPLSKESQAFLDLCWPSSASATLPTKYGLIGTSTQGLQLLLGPWPDQAYIVEIIGTQRPAPLSNSNQTTFLSSVLPDLFLAATMVHFSALKRNFGAQADDPRMAVSWEAQYKSLLASADAEQLRLRYAGSILLPPSGLDKMPAAVGAAKG